MQDEDRLHRLGDTGRAAPEFPQQAPLLQGSHYMLAQRADTRVGQVDGSLTCGKPLPPAAEGHQDWTGRPQTEDTHVTPSAEAVVNGLPDPELRRHLPPLGTRAELPDHALELLPQMLRIRAGPVYGAGTGRSTPT